MVSFTDSYSKKKSYNVNSSYSILFPLDWKWEKVGIIISDLLSETC